MNNKAIITTVVILAVIVIGGLGIWYFTKPASPSSSANSAAGNSNATTVNGTQNQGTSAAKTNAKGTMYFSIADASSNIQGVTAVNMTIDKVELYSQASGWVTASQTPQTFNLLALNAKNQAVLLAKVSAPAGTYTQFHYHIANVMINESGTIKQAVLPSNDFVVNANVIVNANTNSTAQFDVIANDSLHQTASAQFVFTPVVKFDSRTNATVQIGAGNVMSASFGQTNATVNLGMDVDGSIKPDFMVGTNANLNINATGVIQNTGTVNGQVNVGL